MLCARSRRRHRFNRVWEVVVVVMVMGGCLPPQRLETCPSVDLFRIGDLDTCRGESNRAGLYDSFFVVVVVVVLFSFSSVRAGAGGEDESGKL